ncbi:dihydrolipoamide acetyltransferase family protein [Microbacter margulisiae]|uniref:Dihydrolipoamide acetyltransferase component of pyruvate dehydrogenase complex n=1 Tax=Microbacter margulisiae TaxID=1350067 RepID=A0A7W5DMZ3_9PORP|nr:dihydrolipoamide acetyltransferase family protein [Microbacter margulisiae]MBB3185905.1 pyruvate dehydrogenase E2 component (dihydrolipoamide acetyltransferase) [Microbacter margulisiae]
MRYIFNFPDIGEGLDEGTILEWYVEKGQEIKAGQPLVRMETDKVVTDIPSPKNGVIVATFGGVGEIIHVGSPLVEIEMEGVLAAAAVAEAKAPVNVPIEEEGAAVVGTMELAGNSAVLAASEEGDSEQKQVEKPAGKVLATPVARAMARDLNIDINRVSGTGPGGRVTKTDIQNYHATKKSPVVAEAVATVQQLPADRVTYEPLTQIRKAIAKNMLNSKLNAAHMSIFEEVEISELMALRERLKKSRDIKLTYLPFIVKATINALKQHRQINGQMDMENDRMIYKNYYNMAIAVDTPEGLVVPVIRDADKLNIIQIAQKITELSEKAKSRQLTLEDMKDGTFTITNYGSIGGLFATPVINYPQVGILGVGRIYKKPIVKNDQVVAGNVLPLSLSVDHRIVDGGEASRFINLILEYLSDPVLMLLE